MFDSSAALAVMYFLVGCVVALCFWRIATVGKPADAAAGWGLRRVFLSAVVLLMWPGAVVVFLLCLIPAVRGPIEWFIFGDRYRRSDTGTGRDRRRASGA